MAKSRREVTARVVPLASAEAGESRVGGTPSERLALVAELSKQAWALTGRPLPDYSRSAIPISIRPLRVSAAALGSDDQ